MQILNSKNDVVANYSYDAWGNLIEVTDANEKVITSTTNFALINPIRYRGYYYDSETGFYYLKSRYYDPANCRFVSADGQMDLGDGTTNLNLFAYCGNDPVNRVDPDGYCWHCLWITDCDKCKQKKKNTISYMGLFNAVVNNAVNYTAIKTGNYAVSKEIGDKLKMGDGYSSPGLQGAVNALSKCDVSAGVSIGVGIPETWGNLQAGFGTTLSLQNGSKNYAFLGLNASKSFPSLPISLAIDFDIRRSKDEPFVNPGFSKGFGLDTFMKFRKSGFSFSTEIGVSYGENYYWVWDRD